LRKRRFINRYCFNFQEDDQYYEEGGEKDEAPPSIEKDPEPVPVPETTPILPTRVVPNLLSPSFDDSTLDGGLSMTVKPMDELIAPTATISEPPPQIFSSISFPVNSPKNLFQGSSLNFVMLFFCQPPCKTLSLFSRRHIIYKEPLGVTHF
jgi:hypothetical protein